MFNVRFLIEIVLGQSKKIFSGPHLGGVSAGPEQAKIRSKGAPLCSSLSRSRVVLNYCVAN